MKKQILIATTCLILPACGFTPMYGTSSDAQKSSIQASFTNIDISNIPDREGQYLRNALIDRFYRDGRPAQTQYTLSIDEISESIIDLDITKSSDATRAQLKLMTSMTLTDKNSSEIVLTRSLQSISSFNVLTSEFATRVSKKNTRENTLDDLARQIELQIALYLKR